MFLGAALSVAACGGDDGKSGPDAPPAGIDAKVFMDAPGGGGLTGLGQHCDPAMNNADCPANAPTCVGIQGGTATYCTPDCLTNGTATTNAQGQITSTTPAPSTTACSAAYSGTIGAGACGLILAYSPMDNPMMANKQYTGIQLGCVITCSAGACPTGFTPMGSGTSCVCI